MSVSHEQVRHIAKLARIAMSDEELERLLPELNNILGWVEQLGEVNTDGIEALTAVIDQKLRLREDVANDGNRPHCRRSSWAVPMAALACAFNPWMQHTDAVKAEGSVADEAKTAHLLLGQPTGAHLGTVAQG